jgi:Domain of unknown function (DUF4405)
MTSRTAPASKPIWGIRPRLVVDLVLTIGFVVLMSVPFTGLALHEWIGIGLLLVVLLHLLSQWDWTVATSRRLFGTLTGRLRFTYVLNWALFLSVTLVMVSGLAISEAALPRLGIALPRQPFWRPIHTLSANAILVLAGIHVGLNWRWVSNSVRQLVGRRRPVRQASAQGAFS